MERTSRPRVALTGATGFLGGHIHEALRAAGCHAEVLERIALSASDQGLDEALRALGPIDVVVHLAAAGVSPKVAPPEILRTINAVLPARIVAAAARVGVQRVVMAGTAAEYGTSADDFVRLPPDVPLRPTTPYGRSKAAGFTGAVDAALTHHISLEYLRVFNAFGPGQHVQALWPALRQAAIEGTDLNLSTGTQVRDFIPVETVATAFAATVSNEEPAPAVLVRNVGTGEGTTVRAFAEHWWTAWSATGVLRFGAVPDRDDEPRRIVADVSPTQVISHPAES